MSGHDSIDALITENGWPCQRLRMGWSLVLFYFFETLIGKQLPLVMPLIGLAIGLGLLLWAGVAIREWKLQAQLAIIQDALDRRI